MFTSFSWPSQACYLPNFTTLHVCCHGSLRLLWRSFQAHQCSPLRPWGFGGMKLLEVAWHNQRWSQKCGGDTPSTMTKTTAVLVTLGWWRHVTSGIFLPPFFRSCVITRVTDSSRNAGYCLFCLWVVLRDLSFGVLVGQRRYLIGFWAMIIRSGHALFFLSVTDYTGNLDDCL